MSSPSQANAIRPAPSLASLRRAGTPQPPSPLGASVAVDTTPVTAEPSDAIRTGAALSAGRRARDEWASRDQEKVLNADPKFRKYAVLVDRALATIEDAHEWADLITFLAKLLKTLQSHPTYPVVPHKHTVAKRLSQCLNPALPQGVHQRALEVYAHVLTTIGPDGLRRDLQIWSAGLFPFFQYAATSVRPIVLGIFDRFYLPLQEDLRPLMKAFILALLPGLEEETSEHFEKVCSLLDRLGGTVTPAFFLQNVWLILLTSSGTGYRIPALNYLSRRMPKLEGRERVSMLVGDDVGLMVRGFAASLEDGNVLVQRGVLDLLLSTLRLDSVGFREDTRSGDQILLMRAAVGVVLRRDISLSRRLYSWLLGPFDEPSDQSTYLRQHGLGLLTDALLADMGVSQAAAEEPSTATRQRGFKIFIALLDKWEIAELIIDSAIMEALVSLKTGIQPVAGPATPEKSLAKSDELLPTANMLFDALDPFVTWRKFFVATVDAVTAGKLEPLKLLLFTVTTFRIHDEELLKLHAPLLAFAVIDLVAQGHSDDPQSHPVPATTEDRLSLRLAALDLSLALLKLLPASFFESDGVSNLGVLAGPSALDVARRFYAARDITEATSLIAAGGLFQSSRLCSLAVSRLMGSIAADAGPRSTHDGASLLKAKAAAAIEYILAATKASGARLVVEWKPPVWAADALLDVEAAPLSPHGFDSTSSLLRVLLALSDSAVISPALAFADPRLVSVAIGKLLAFLHGDSAPYYVQATQLVWAVQRASPPRCVEAILCARLTSTDARAKAEAFEAFGNLWRHTDDASLPGTHFRLPMTLVLDSLRDDSLTCRRLGEAWMRCSLKSYLRVLDPLLTDLLDPRIRFDSIKLQVDGLDATGYQYSQPFNDRTVEHSLECILSLAKFGGQGFARIAASCPLKSTLDPALRLLLRPDDLDSASYLDKLNALLIQFILCEPAPALVRAMATTTQRIHSVCADLLQILVSRGDLSNTALLTIEDALLKRLTLCIHRGELDLQNKFLHVLHATVAALAVIPARRRSSSVSRIGPVAGDSPQSSQASFVRVLGDGVCQSNSAVVHHWIDFLLMTVPQYRRSLPDVVNPLIDRLSLRLQAFGEELRATYDPDFKGKRPSSGSTDSDFAALANALERVIVVAIDEGAAAVGVEDDSKGAKSPPSEASGFLGGIGGVFGVLSGSELPSAQLSGDKPKTDFLRRLERAITILLDAWCMSSVVAASPTSSSGLYMTRIKARTRKSFEKLYRALPGETVEAIMEYWSRPRMTSGMIEDHVFELLDHLSPSAQAVVGMLYERLAARGHLSGTDRGRAVAATSFVSESLLFQFLEVYIARLEGPIALQVWSASLTFGRDILDNPITTRAQVFPTLRCFVTLGDKISQTSALEDRRIRRDLQETFTRLCETVLQGLGKNTDGNLWRRSEKAELNGDGASTVSDKGAGDEPKAEDDGKAIESPPELATTTATDVARFFADRVLPGCRRYLLEPDRVATMCTNVMYYLVSPAFKIRTRSMDVDPVLIDLLSEMTKHAAALKAWRGQVVEAFSDNRFFNSTPDTGARWRPVIQALIASDKERFPDMLNKVSAASSANIFTNRELEMLSRSFNLRRITYVIFSGDHNRYLNHLPIIQEKVVDLLRSNVGEMVHAEVYLCMRVLLCRMGGQHLAGFWPVILTELTKLFESLAESLPESPHFLALVLAASKFLDLLITLQTEDFQIHQWMFITDTVDAIYPPDGWSPAALLDRLASVFGGSHDSPSPLRLSPRLNPSPLPLAAPGSSRRVGLKSPGRRPVLDGVRRIETAEPLERWFSHVSLANYEAVYQGGSVDWAAVENDLECDIFDG